MSIACPAARRDAILAFLRDAPFWDALEAEARTAPRAHAVDVRGICALVLNTVCEAVLGIDAADEPALMQAYVGMCHALFNIDIFLSCFCPNPRRARRIRAQLANVIGVPPDAHPRPPQPLRDALDALFLADTGVFAEYRD